VCGTPVGDEGADAVGEVSEDDEGAAGCEGRHSCSVGGEVEGYKGGCYELFFLGGVGSLLIYVYTSCLSFVTFVTLQGRMPTTRVNAAAELSRSRFRPHQGIK